MDLKPDMTIMDIINEPTLTYREIVLNLAKFAENSVDSITYPEREADLLRRDVIFDMGEGLTPYRPRYCVPDYDLFFKNGSKFLELEPPTDIWSAVGNLMCLYHNLTGAGALPVFAGRLDELLEPFITDEAEAKKAIKMLLVHVDRTIGTAFLHVDLSPRKTRAGMIILELSEEMRRPCPNMTLLYDPDVTPDDYALRAIECGLSVSKPCFANHRLYSSETKDYAVVSCYNVLPTGGSGMTLTRLNLHRLPALASSVDDLLERVIPEVTAAMCTVIDCRIRFMVEDCHYFERNFLCKEGLVRFDDEHMVGMFGYVGLAECVNAMLGAKDKSERYGSCEKADALGEAIMDKLAAEMSKYKPKYGHYALHAQSGVTFDTESSPGGRIPIGDEPELPRHIAQYARMHQHCVAGCSEIFPFDETAKKNPTAVLQIIKGAFSLGARYLAFSSSDSDLIRVTGYLVKKSDIEKYRAGTANLNDATSLGYNANTYSNLFARKVRKTQ